MDENPLVIQSYTHRAQDHSLSISVLPFSSVPFLLSLFTTISSANVSHRNMNRKKMKNGIGCGVVVVVRIPELKPIETISLKQNTETAPYENDT